MYVCILSNQKLPNTIQKILNHVLLRVFSSPNARGLFGSKPSNFHNIVHLYEILTCIL